MLYLRTVIPLLWLLTFVSGKRQGLRRRRRAILEIESHEDAAQLLTSLWEADGIQPNQAHHQTRKEWKKSKVVSNHHEDSVPKKELDEKSSKSSTAELSKKEKYNTIEDEFFQAGRQRELEFFFEDMRFLQMSMSMSMSMSM